MSERISKIMSSPENGELLVKAILAVQSGSKENAAFTPVENDKSSEPIPG